MTILELEDVDANVTTEDASTLGFPVGKWPVSFRYDGQRLFLQTIERDGDGDVKWADYGYDGGLFRVFND